MKNYLMYALLVLGVNICYSMQPTSYLFPINTGGASSGRDGAATPGLDFDGEVVTTPRSDAMSPDSEALALSIKKVNQTSPNKDNKRVSKLAEGLCSNAVLQIDKVKEKFVGSPDGYEALYQEAQNLIINANDELFKQVCPPASDEVKNLYCDGLQVSFFKDVVDLAAQKGNVDCCNYVHNHSEVKNKADSFKSICAKDYLTTMARAVEMSLPKGWHLSKELWAVLLQYNIAPRFAFAVRVKNGDQATIDQVVDWADDDQDNLEELLSFKTVYESSMGESDQADVTKKLNDFMKNVELVQSEKRFKRDSAS